MRSTADGPAGGISPSALQSVTIDVLRFPMAVMVVFIHSFLQPAAADLPPFSPEMLRDGAEWYNLLRCTLSYVLPSVAVPGFFFLSGYLFFARFRTWDWGMYREKMRKRVWMLLVPYVVWNVVYVVWQIALGVLWKGGDFATVSAEKFGAFGLDWLWSVNVWGTEAKDILGGTLCCTGPATIPLWFLRDLICVTVLSPVVYFVVRRTRIWGVLALCVLYVTELWPSVPGLRSDSVFFFCFGAYYGVWGRNFVQDFRRFRWPVCVAALCLLPVGVLEYRVVYQGYLPVRHFYVVAGVMAAFVIASCAAERWRLQRGGLLAESSFFVYAFHSFCSIAVAHKFLELLLPAEPVWALTLNYLLTPLLAVAVCLATYVLARRFCPRLLSLFTGGR